MSPSKLSANSGRYAKDKEKERNIIKPKGPKKTESSSIAAVPKKQDPSSILKDLAKMR